MLITRSPGLGALVEREGNTKSDESAGPRTGNDGTAILNGTLIRFWSLAVPDEVSGARGPIREIREAKNRPGYCAKGRFTIEALGKTDPKSCLTGGHSRRMSPLR